MASSHKKVKDNVEGNFFVDTTCINCDACRKFAPNVFADNQSYSYVAKQPQTNEEKLQATQALLSCPVGSIGMNKIEGIKNAQATFPLNIEGDVYLNGYNHKSSYGADSYLIKSIQGNWMIDSPRFARPLVDQIHQMGGLKYIFLTHQDDVADAHLYANEFKAQRIIHRFDSKAQKEAEIILEDQADKVMGQARIIFTPGHTKGHCVLLWDEKYLFTGDHYSWSDSSKNFRSFRDFCWDSWDQQIKSVQKLRAFKSVKWVLPGHGRRNSIQNENFPQIIDESVTWMNSVR